MTAHSTGIRITGLRLAQYRSYDLADVETAGRSIALYGPNGAGKTNLLEAVSMLVPGRGLRRAGADEVARAGGPGGWRVRADVQVIGDPVEIVTGAEGAGARRTVEIDGKAAAQTRLGEIVRMVWLTPVMDRLWLEGAVDRRRFLDRMVMGFSPSHAETATAYEKAMRERNRLLKEPFTDTAWIGGLEAQMARLGARIARGRAEALTCLVAAQDHAGSSFPRADLSIEGGMEARFGAALADGRDLDLVEIDEAAGLAETLQQGRMGDARAGRTLAGPHRSDLEAVYAAKAMPARACSTGEQKALLISLCLANARALADATGAAPVLLLDEVAAHLDEGRRRALFAEIAALGAQAFMTGTGPELFDGLDADALRIEVGEDAGATRLLPAG